MRPRVVAAPQTRNDGAIPNQALPTAWYTLQPEGDTVRLVVGGAWTRSEARRLDPLLRPLQVHGYKQVEIDCKALSGLDTVGAWLLLRTGRTWQHQDVIVNPVNVAAEYEELVHAINHESQAPPVELRPHRPFTGILERTGRGFWHALQQAYGLVGFFGLIMAESLATVLQPRRLRITPLVHQVEEIGLNSLPIVGLLSLLIGVVFTYQGSDELHKFGAEVFTINLVGVGVLRELGGMMAAIIIAGRSGSAFAAQIGTMKVSEELDAIQVGGLNLIQVLVLPRLFGVMISLPLLTFYSNIMGLLGGAAVCHFYLGITIPVFLNQLRSAIIGGTFWLGLIKAPVFACIIGLVGCHQGLQVEGNAGSVGRHTTLAVVEAIFLVIVADAIFSVLFTVVGL